MQLAKSLKPATESAVNGLRSMQSGKMLDKANLNEVVFQAVARPSPAIESSDNYLRTVAILNDRWRVIECTARIQWILQYRASASAGHARSRWAGRSFCRTREALIACCIRLCGTARGLDRLPERIGAPA